MDGASLAGMLLRLAVSMAVVIGLMVLAARLLQGRVHGLGRPGSGALAVVERRPLGRNASVAVVEAAGRTLVVGVTERAISLLAELDSAPAADLATPSQDAAWTPRPEGEAAPAQAWKDFLDTLRERTVRKG